jgi:hypothetical protein
MDPKYLSLVSTATQILTEANVAAPVVASSILMIVNAVKAVTGSGPSLAELIPVLRDAIGTTDAHLEAEIARLQAIHG